MSKIGLEQALDEGADAMRRAAKLIDEYQQTIEWLAHYARREIPGCR